jgi:hypothetical protein
MAAVCVVFFGGLEVSRSNEGKNKQPQILLLRSLLRPHHQDDSFIIRMMAAFSV